MNLDKIDNWVFGDKQSGIHLLKFRWFEITRHARGYWQVVIRRPRTKGILGREKQGKNQGTAAKLPENR